MLHLPTCPRFTIALFWKATLYMDNNSYRKKACLRHVRYLPCGFVTMRFYVESILIFLLFQWPRLQRNISVRLHNREHEIQPDAVIKATYSSLEPAYATLYFGDKSAPRGKRRLGTMPSDTLVGGTKKTVHHPSRVFTQ